MDGVTNNTPIPPAPAGRKTA
ncbi:MAG: hypothetical protein ACLSHA_10780 [Neglectibacter timonensis]